MTAPFATASFLAILAGVGLAASLAGGVAGALVFAGRAERVGVLAAISVAFFLLG